MARYQDDFEQWGTRPVLANPGARGRDPNYRGGGYQGERMQSSQGGQAAYGRYRQLNANDLQGYGGSEGVYGGYDRNYRPERQGGRTPPQYTGQYESGYSGYGEQPRRGYDREQRPRNQGGYDREQHQGNPGGLRENVRYLSDFNKNSPALRGDEGQQGQQGQTRRSSGFADDSPDPRRWRTGGSRSDRYDEEHNRYGRYSSAGFAEYWLPKQAPRGTPHRHTGGK